jgi:predicted transcriptional regulator
MHPEHVAKIIAGEKTVEYRKIMPSKQATHLVIYCTNPVQKIVAVTEVDRCVTGNLEKIWKKTEDQSGITHEFYAAKYETASAFILGKTYQLQTQFVISDMTSCKAPPQSFCYLNDRDTDLFAEIIDYAKMELDPSRLSLAAKRIAAYLDSAKEQNAHP